MKHSKNWKVALFFLASVGVFVSDLTGAGLQRFAEPFEWATAQGLLPLAVGTASSPVSRGEFVEAMMLARFGVDSPETSECLTNMEPLAADVPVTHALHPFLCLAVESGMLRNSPASNFRPVVKVSIREAARAYVRLVGAEKVRAEQQQAAAKEAEASAHAENEKGLPTTGELPPLASKPVVSPRAPAPPRRSSPALSRAELAVLLYRVRGPDPAPTDVPLPILFFHHILEFPEDHPNRAEYELSLAPARLEQMLKFIQSEKVATLTFDELEQIRKGNAAVPERAIMLTFDDGYKDNFTEAFRLLEKYGLKGNFSVVTSTVGRDDRHMSWEDVQEIAAAGHQISSHTHTHPDLPSLSDKRLRRELRRSRRLLEEKIGRPVTSLVYPAGRVDDRVVKEALAAGYTLGRTTRSGRRLDLSNPMTLPGVRTFPESGAASIKRWLGPWPPKS